jgi:MFS_1 like family
MFWGYIESYLFWFLEDMGGTKSLMGLTLTISALSGIPALLISDYVFRKIGHPNVQVIGFIFYVFRLFGTATCSQVPPEGLMLKFQFQIRLFVH